MLLEENRKWFPTLLEEVTTICIILEELEIISMFFKEST